MEFLSANTTSMVTYVTLAVVVILLVLVTIICFKVCKENFVGVGYANNSPTGVSGALSSGATMRRLSTGFSQPGQGQHDTVYIDEIKEVVPGLIGGESLVGSRESPNFWEVGSTLDEYRRGEGRYSEGLNSGSAVSIAEEGQLANLLR